MNYHQICLTLLRHLELHLQSCRAQKNKMALYIQRQTTKNTVITDCSYVKPAWYSSFQAPQHSTNLPNASIQLCVVCTEHARQIGL